MTGIFEDVAAAFQFLTRLPLFELAYEPNTLARAAKFFPLVGLVVGVGDAGVYRLLSPRLPPAIVALLIVLFSTLVTGGLHEDGLADAVDGFGGGWNRQQILEIMKDSRVGSYGALALVFSVVARVMLLSFLPVGNFVQYVISAEILCRWIMLPLGISLPSVRESASQGARLAGKISTLSLAVGTLTALCMVGFLLRISMVWPFAATLAVASVSGWYYKRRIGGISGDCFGASSQLTLVAVYVCGVWHG